MAQTQGAEQGCCPLEFLKYVLYVFNIVFLLAGLGVLGTALWTITDKYQYVELLTTATYPIITYFLLTAGALVFFVALLGWYSTCKNHRPCLILYIFLLLFIFLAEAMVGILAYVYQEQVHSELELNLNNTFLNTYKVDESKTDAIDFLQREFYCCGAVSFDDWRYSKWKSENLAGDNLVPDSCCKSFTIECGKRDHPSNINYSGCLSRMEQHMKDHLLVLSAVGLGICVLQVFGIVFACMLYFKLKDVCET